MALPGAAHAAPGTLDLRQSFDHSRGSVRRGVVLVRARPGRARQAGGCQAFEPAALSDAAPAGSGPLHGDQLPATLRRQLRDARPAHRPLRAARADPLRRPDRGGAEGPSRPPLHDEPQGTAGALPTRRACARGPALAARARRQQLVGALGLVGAHAQLRAAARLREREPGEGDAAGGVPARHRQPSAGCRRARLARSDDHGLVERRGGHRLLPRRRRGPVPARSPGWDAQLLGGRLLGERPVQRTGSGALLQQDRQARSEGLARVRPRASVLDREPPALGLFALLDRGRLQDVLQGRLARDRRRTARA